MGLDKRGAPVPAIPLDLGDRDTRRRPRGAGSTGRTRRRTPWCGPPVCRDRLVRRSMLAVVAFVRSLPVSGPWATSVVAHIGLLILLVCWTVATQEPPQPVALTVATTSVDRQPLELLTASFEDLPESPVKEDLDEQEIVDPELVSTSLATMEEAVIETSIADLLPSSVPSVAGETDRGPQKKRKAGAGKSKRSRDEVQFFGARGEAQSVVFLVDNSNSMHSGRFETALFEIQRSIDALHEDQSFYIVFYSDTAYGTFHPDETQQWVTATADNKRRTREWLLTVQMCTGGRILRGLEKVEAIQPELVFLLSDGIIESEQAMQRLLDTSDRAFAIHAIGLTVPNARAAARLTAIAHANRGNARFVDVHPIAREASKRRPIPRNRTRGPVWGKKLPLRVK